MKQQRQLVSKCAQLLYQVEQELSSKNSMGNSCSALGKELSQVVKLIQNYLAEAQYEKEKYLEELDESKTKIKLYQTSLKQMNQELQRLRLLLPIKEQLITSCKKEISALQNTIKQSMQTTTNRGQHADEFAVSRVFSDIELTFKQQQNRTNRYGSIGFLQTKPKISYKKNLDEAYHKDLKIAKLKNETCKLSLENRNLRAEMELLKIQNSHLIVQLQIFTEEMDFANNFVNKISNKALNTGLSSKCQKLESYIDKLTSKLQKMQVNENTHGWNNRIDIPLHPPTPHFSGGNFGFGRKQKSFEFPEVLQINESIISMGESISEGLE